MNRRQFFTMAGAAVTGWWSRGLVAAGVKAKPQSELARLATVYYRKKAINNLKKDFIFSPYTSFISYTDLEKPQLRRGDTIKIFPYAAHKERIGP